MNKIEKIADRLKVAIEDEDWAAVEALANELDPPREDLKFPSIHCISCGKLMTTEIANYGNVQGTSFQLSFPYGSALDGIGNILGHICDECVIKKHEHLLWVQKPTSEITLHAWHSTLNLRPLKEHPEMGYWFKPRH